MLRRSSIAAAVGTALTLTACGGGGGIAGASSCAELADAAIDEVQKALDAVADLSMEDLASGEPPAAFDDLDEMGEQIEDKGQELCDSESEFEGLMADRADQLEANGPIAELILQGIQEGGF